MIGARGSVEEMRSAPAPWLRRLYAAPNAVYARGWGRLLGHRFVQLTHTGRRSGRTYRVVLEVARYDRTTGEATVTAGYGRGSDWFRNVRAGGPTWIDFGRGPRPATHRELSQDEAISVIADYERRARLARPLVRRVLGSLAGFDYRGSEADRRRLVETLPMVAFTPQDGSEQQGP